MHGREELREDWHEEHAADDRIVKIELGQAKTQRCLADLSSPVRNRKGDIIANACKCKACTNQCLETVFCFKLPSKKTHIECPTIKKDA